MRLLCLLYRLHVEEAVNYPNLHRQERRWCPRTVNLTKLLQLSSMSPNRQLRDQEVALPLMHCRQLQVHQSPLLAVEMVTK